MPLGIEVGLRPGDFVFDGDQASLPKKGAEPHLDFWPMCIAAKRLHESRCHLVFGTDVALSPDDIVLDGDPVPPSPKRGQSPLPNFRPVSIVAKLLDGSRWHLAWMWALVQATLC